EYDFAASFSAARSQLHHVLGHLDRRQIVLDNEYTVAGVAQSLQQLEQPVHVARMQANRWLVENIERVNQLRAKRIGESDSLGLAAGQRARRPIHGEVAESDVAQKCHPITRFLENHFGDAALEVRELQLIEPRRQLIDRELRDLRDVQTANADVERVRLELGAVTAGTLLRRLILPQENADVLLVALLLEILEKREDSLVAARPRFQQQLSLRGSELIPRLVHRDALALCKRGKRAALVVVTRLGPRIDSAIA